MIIVDTDLSSYQTTLQNILTKYSTPNSTSLNISSTNPIQNLDQDSLKLICSKFDIRQPILSANGDDIKSIINECQEQLSSLETTGPFFKHYYLNLTQRDMFVINTSVAVTSIIANLFDIISTAVRYLFHLVM
jgi:hypothetical protein